MSVHGCPSSVGDARERPRGSILEGTIRGMLVAGLFGLIAAGVWLRVTSLGTAPVPTSDEAVYGVQGHRLLQGRAVRPWAESGHPLSPFLIVLEALPALVWKPSYESLRIPAVLIGLATLAACYGLGRRIFDGPTGAIAAGTMAVLPIAIIYSRMAWEPCLIPLYSLICLAIACQARPVPLLVAWILGIALVHPTVLMLGPILLAVLVARQIPLRLRAGVDPWRVPRRTLLVGLLLITILASAAFRTKAALWTFITYSFGPADWSLYLGRLRGMFLGSPWRDLNSSGVPALAFWGVIAGVAVIGTPRLIRQRAWDRLALLGATVCTAAALHVALGPDIIRPGFERYAVFLVVPSVFSFASLVRASLPTSAGTKATVIRVVCLLLLIGGGAGLLRQAQVNWFDTYVIQSRGAESFWTWKTETKELNQEIFLSLDAPSGGNSHRLIIAENWWHEEIIRYLAQGDKCMRVHGLETLNPEERQAALRRVLVSGGVAIGDMNGALPVELAASVPAADLDYKVFAVDWNRPAFVTWIRARR